MTWARGAQRVLRALHHLENATLALLLAALILLASLQIALRNLFDTSLVWGEPLLRILVLWIGLIGAMVASRDHRQISIDAISRLLPERARLAARALTSAFAAGVSAVIAVHAARFVAAEYAYASATVAGLPVWVFQAILPFAFGTIALSYLAALVRDLGATLAHPRDPS